MPGEDEAAGSEKVGDDMEGAGAAGRGITDQADIDNAVDDSRRAADNAAWSRRSQVLQRYLPRPTVVNNSILRPAAQAQGVSVTDLQKVGYFYAHFL